MNKIEKYDAKIEKSLRLNLNRSAGEPNSKERTRYISNSKKDAQRVKRIFRKISSAAKARYWA